MSRPSMISSLRALVASTVSEFAQFRGYPPEASATSSTVRLCQRSAELVRSVGRELALALEGRIEAPPA